MGHIERPLALRALYTALDLREGVSGARVAGANPARAPARPSWRTVASWIQGGARGKVWFGRAPEAEGGYDLVWLTPQQSVGAESGCGFYPSSAPNYTLPGVGSNPVRGGTA